MKKNSKHIFRYNTPDIPDNSEPSQPFLFSSSNNTNYNPFPNPSNSSFTNKQSSQNFRNSPQNEEDEEKTQFRQTPQKNNKFSNSSQNYQKNSERTIYRAKNYQKASEKPFYEIENQPSNNFFQKNEESELSYLTKDNLDQLLSLKSKPEEFNKSFMSLTPMNHRLDKTKSLNKLMANLLEALSVLVRNDSHETFDILKDCFDSKVFCSIIKEELVFHQTQIMNGNKFKFILNMLINLYELFLYITRRSKELVKNLCIHEVSETIDNFLNKRPNDMDLMNFKEKFMNLEEISINIKKEDFLKRIEDMKKNETFEKKYDVQISYKEANINPTESDCLNIPQKNPFFPHIIKGPYPSTELYLNNMFYLLKEDFMIGIRKTFDILQNNEISKKFDPQIFDNAYLYKDVKIQDVIFGINGIFFKVILTPWLKKKSKNINWISTKRMNYGSLMIITDETYDKMFFATVFEKPSGQMMNAQFQKHGNNMISIKGLVENENVVEMINDLNRRKLMIVEARTYFESYYHFLRQIQNINPENMPFNEIIVKAKADTVDLPKYLKRNDVNNNAGDYIFNLDFEENEVEGPIAVQKLDVLQEKWPEYMKKTLDDSQYRALQNILTKNVSIIQGPPGTGKTYSFF